MDSQTRGVGATPQKPLMVQPPDHPVISNPFQVADCRCDGNTLGRYCNRSKDPCDEQCFPNVKCISGKGCEACPPNLTGDGRHCARELGTGPRQEEVLGTGDISRA